jgi:hypothetical protein
MLLSIARASKRAGLYDIDAPIVCGSKPTPVITSDESDLKCTVNEKLELVLNRTRRIRICSSHRARTKGTLTTWMLQPACKCLPPSEMIFPLDAASVSRKRITAAFRPRLPLSTGYLQWKQSSIIRSVMMSPSAVTMRPLPRSFPRTLPIVIPNTNIIATRTYRLWL